MIVREREIERCPGVDRDKAERNERSVAGERRIELALDFARQRLQRIVAFVYDGEWRPARSARVLEALTRRVEREPGEPSARARR
jgi:hypothetical protein